MPKFKVISSEVVVYETTVEAKDKDEALEKLNIDANDKDYTYGWQIESVEEL